MKQKTTVQRGDAMTTLPVNEIFFSLQGEGTYTGCPAVFIRLQGCSVGCPYCDTQYAQQCDPSLRRSDPAIVFLKKRSNALYADLDSSWLVQEVNRRSQNRPIAVITGGEPCQYDLTPLTSALLSEGYPVHIETSGTELIRCHKECRITLSPKRKAVREENWQRAQEIKLPVLTENDVQRYFERLKSLEKDVIICLQPVSCDPTATTLCVRLCQEHNWRLSLQMHKYLGIA